MIKRNLERDIEHQVPLSAFDENLKELQASPLIWHAILMPDEKHIVFTGHINCHDCEICKVQGPVQWTRGDPVPWKAEYADCCDPPD